MPPRPRQRRLAGLKEAVALPVLVLVGLPALLVLVGLPALMVLVGLPALMALVELPALMALVELPATVMLVPPPIFGDVDPEDFVQQQPVPDLGQAGGRA